MLLRNYLKTFFCVSRQSLSTVQNMKYTFDIFAWKNFQISKLFSAINKHRPRTYWPTPLGHLYTHRAFAYPEIFCRNKKILFPFILRLVIKKIK